MKALLLLPAGAVVSNLALSRLESEAAETERLRCLDFSLGTLQTAARLSGAEAVYAAAVPTPLAEAMASSVIPTAGTPDHGWSLQSIPVRLWDLLGGAGGAWVTVGRIWL